jgi:hypothetical protein
LNYRPQHATLRVTMPGYRVTAKRKNADDELYDRMLDTLEAQHQMAPINPGEDSRVYLVEAGDQHDAARRIGLLLESMHYGNWPDHIAGFEAEAA